MKFASTRLIARDIKAVVGFYEMVTGQAAEWLAPVFAEIVKPFSTLAFGSAYTVALFKGAPRLPRTAASSSSSWSQMSTPSLQS